FPGGKKLILRGGKLCGDSSSGGIGGIIMGYKYDPEWAKIVAKYKATKIEAIATWRSTLFGKGNKDIQKKITDATCPYRLFKGYCGKSRVLEIHNPGDASELNQPNQGLLTN